MATRPSEHDEQVALFQWAEMQTAVYPELEWLFAVPNGGKRHKATAVKLKAEGVKAGVPDVLLPVPCGEFIGLAIEMKVGRNKTSDSQDRWLEGLRSNGWKTAVCYGFYEAKEVIENYLGDSDRPIAYWEAR